MLRYETTSSTGKRAPSDTDTPAASVELEKSNEGQLQMQWKEENTHQGGEVREEKEHKASFGNEASQQSQTQTVLKLSFSEDQSFSSAPFGGDHNVSELPTGDEQSLLESTHPEESDMEETGEVSKVTEQGRSEVFSFEEINGYSYSEEDIEPSTDEELRLWRYPQDKVCNEEESIIAEEQEEDVCVKEEEGDLESSRVEKEEGGSVADGIGHPDIQDYECYLAYVSAEIAGSSEVQEDEKPRAEKDKLESESFLNDPVKDQSALDQGNVESCKGCYEGALTGDMDTFTKKQDQKDIERCTHENEICQQPNESLTVNIKENGDLESDRKGPDGRVKQTEESHLADVALALKETQTEDTELEINIEDIAKPKVETRAESSGIDGSDVAQCLTKGQVSDHLLEDIEQDAVNERQGVVEGLTGETHKAEGGENSKKVTFILEPELINDSTLSESNTSMESTAETRMSGEKNTKKM